VSNTDAPRDDQQSDVRIRRAPKLTRFLIVGGGLGAILTFIATALFPVDPDVGFGALFGYFAIFGVSAGVVVGAIIAISLDRRSDRNARTVGAVVEKTEADERGRTYDAPFPARPDAVDGDQADAGTAAPVPNSTPKPTPTPAPSPQAVFDQDDAPAVPRSAPVVPPAPDTQA
jgi:hypothetical protein